MTKVDALIALIKDNGGVASWQYIYDNIEKYYPAAKASRTWKSGLRGVLYREIRNNRNFKCVGFGVYALNEYEEEKAFEDIRKNNVRMHSYIEGLLVELGNYEKFDTYCADPTAKFQANVFINQIATILDFPEFTYPEINYIAKRIDVIWFTKTGHKFPKKAIEVVDGVGTLEEALSRMYQLKEFQTDFLVVSPLRLLNKINDKLKREPYSIYKERFSVKCYDDIINYYKNRLEIEKLYYKNRLEIEKLKF